MDLNMSYGEIIDKIASETELSLDEVIKLIREKVKELSGFITLEGAALIIAEELQVNVYATPVELELPPTENTESVKKQGSLDDFVNEKKLFVKHADKQPNGCFYCDHTISNGDKKCSNCGKDVLKCSLCKLPVFSNQEAGTCSLCGVVGHFTHMFEWVKVNGKCASCLQELPVDGIIPLSEINIRK